MSVRAPLLHHRPRSARTPDPAGIRAWRRLLRRSWRTSGCGRYVDRRAGRPRWCSATFSPRHRTRDVALSPAAQACPSLRARGSNQCRLWNPVAERTRRIDWPRATEQPSARSSRFNWVFGSSYPGGKQGSRACATRLSKDTLALARRNLHHGQQCSSNAATSNSMPSIGSVSLVFECAAGHIDGSLDRAPMDSMRHARNGGVSCPIPGDALQQKNVAYVQVRVATRDALPPRASLAEALTLSSALRTIRAER